MEEDGELMNSGTFITDYMFNHYIKPTMEKLSTKLEAKTTE